MYRRKKIQTLSQIYMDINNEYIFNQIKLGNKKESI